MKAIRTTLLCLLLATYGNAQKVSVSPVVSAGYSLIKYFNDDGSKLETDEGKFPTPAYTRGMALRFSIDLFDWMDLSLQMGVQYTYFDLFIDGDFSMKGYENAPDYTLDWIHMGYEQNLMYFAVLPEFSILPEKQLFVRLGPAVNFPAKDGYLNTGSPSYNPISVIDKDGYHHYGVEDFNPNQSHPYMLLFNIGGQWGTEKLKFLVEGGYIHIPKSKFEKGDYVFSGHYLPSTGFSILQVSVGVNYYFN
ncbi:hypothetical protein Oweho_1976 [Owenweeksia hongkongensis DSM 17368]|uniref:Outer membrane protein beta-barrel domain-containing protein n=1 Tax=Owenweeksia hongkongensis (strain DSM 17368 / CIP 108786 / JCM 12287 / NRRL B-23963 / UST20020801) TaxID=926562 RepID=G8R2W1_OWEHD|nr:hypothetical protein [Owenweeksia hongkongensis]AEV32955.1 hypothetical protein Oweho_1976 [Owenweeksia hongkongensis DSM 17368]